MEATDPSSPQYHSILINQRIIELFRYNGFLSCTFKATHSSLPLIPSVALSCSLYISRVLPPSLALPSITLSIPSSCCCSCLFLSPIPMAGFHSWVGRDLPSPPIPTSTRCVSSMSCVEGWLLATGYCYL